MASAATQPVIEAESGRRSVDDVSLENLLAYARDRLAAAAAYPKDRLVRRDLRLASLDLTAWFTSEALADLCVAKLVQRECARPFEADAEIFALDAEADRWDMPAMWREGAGFSSREFDRALAAGNLRGFYHHDAPSWQFYDASTATGVHTLPRPLGIPPWEEGSPLRLFLHWAYAAAGKRLTHAATLGLNGRGVLIAGASGSGKSGTTLAGLLNGLDSVGDDYVLVEQGSSVVAHAVFRVFKQDPEGLRRAGLSREALGDTRLNWHDKIEFDAAGLSPDRFVERMDICALLLPEIARSKHTQVERVSTKDAALGLAPSSVFQLPGDAGDGFRFLAALVKRLPAYRVSLSENPAEIADTIGSFLEREVQHSG